MLLNLILFITLTEFTLAETQCGIKGSSHPLWRIIGGNDTKPLEYPWMAFLGCGGAIINEEWVMTAGHCASPSFKGGFLLGAYDINRYGKNYSLESTAVIVNASQTFRHPKYDPDPNGPDGGRPKYDISLIKMKQKLDFNGKHKHLRPICLPNSNITVKDLIGSECVVMGWGKTNTSEHSEVFPLQVTSAPIISSDICVKEYPKDFDPSYAICAGYPEGGHGTCFGDSGGPLQCKLADKRWYIFGTVSWGVPCAKPGFPDVYGSVIALLDWIQTTIENN